MTHSESTPQTNSTHVSVVIPNWLLGCIDSKILDIVLEQSKEKLYRLTRSKFIIDSIIAAHGFNDPAAIGNALPNNPTE